MTDKEKFKKLTGVDLPDGCDLHIINERRNVTLYLTDEEEELIRGTLDLKRNIPEHHEIVVMQIKTEAINTFHNEALRLLKARGRKIPQGNLANLGMEIYAHFIEKGMRIQPSD